MSAKQLSVGKLDDLITFDCRISSFTSSLDGGDVGSDCVVDGDGGIYATIEVRHLHESVTGQNKKRRFPNHHAPGSTNVRMVNLKNCFVNGKDKIRLQNSS